MVAARKRKGSAAMSTAAKRRRVAPKKAAAKKGVVSGRKMYPFSRYVNADNQTLLTVTTGNFSVGLGKAFSIESVVNPSDFSALFDQYCIKKVYCYFKLQTNPNAVTVLNLSTVATGNAAIFYPKLWWHTDDDDITVPSLDKIKERQGVKCRVLAIRRTAFLLLSNTFNAC